MNDPNQDLINMIRQASNSQPANDDQRERLRQQVLDVYDNRVERNKKLVRPISYSLKGTTLMKLSASIALLAVIGFFTNTIFTPTNVLAFSDVARALLSIRNASFEVIVTSKFPGEAPEIEGPIKCIVHLPDQIRVESPDGEIIIGDSAADKMLTIDTKSKLAVLVDGFAEKEIDEEPENFLGDIQEHLRRAQKGNRFDDVKYTTLGKKKINGKQALGYRIHDPKERDFDFADIWADPETNLPLQIDYTLIINDGNVVSTMTKLKFNQEFDPQLFSLEPPIGFELVKQEAPGYMELDDKPAPIALDEAGGLHGEIVRETFHDFVEALRVYTEWFDGHFPPNLENGLMTDALVEAWEKANPGKPLFNGDDFSDPMLDDAFGKIVLSSVFIDSLKKLDIKYTYAGEGVKFGNKDRPIFWFKSIDAKSFTVIYGDLDIRQVEQAPVKP